jgi:prepilin-type N-terminal cleavage/methylation domain-containing protein
MNKSFTLIEILVVIVVIGILSAFILVGMSSISNGANIAKGQAFSNSLRNSLLINLVSEWKFDGTGINDGQPATTAYTQDSWNSNNGTIAGHEPDVKSGSNCISGSCLQFIGANSDYVDCGNSATGSSLDLRNNFTLEAWVAGATTDGTIVGRSANYSIAGLQWVLRQNGTNAFYFGISDGVDWKFASWGIPIVNGQWYHIVATYDSLNGKIYGNGLLKQTSANIIAPLQHKDNNVMIGGGTAYYYNGKIDEVRIYKETIPTSQIQQNYFVGLNKLFKSHGIALNKFNQRITELKSNLANNE